MRSCRRVSRDPFPVRFVPLRSAYRTCLMPFPRSFASRRPPPRTAPLQRHLPARSGLRPTPRSHASGADAAQGAFCPGSFLHPRRTLLMLRLKRAATLAAILFAAACTADSISPTAPTGPLETISDAAHAGVVPGFYFLPPMVPQPTYSGTFDAALQPRVEICEVNAGICTTTIATFTFGTGSSSVRLDAAGQNYI